MTYAELITYVRNNIIAEDTASGGWNDTTDILPELWNSSKIINASMHLYKREYELGSLLLNSELTRFQAPHDMIGTPLDSLMMNRRRMGWVKAVNLQRRLMQPPGEPQVWTYANKDDFIKIAPQLSLPPNHAYFEYISEETTQNTFPVATGLDVYPTTTPITLTRIVPLPTALKIEWELHDGVEADPLPSAYILYIRKNADPFTTTTFGVGTSSHTVSGLDPNSVYELYVVGQSTTAQHSSPAYAVQTLRSSETNFTTSSYSPWGGQHSSWHDVIALHAGTNLWMQVDEIERAREFAQLYNARINAFATQLNRTNIPNLVIPSERRQESGVRL